MYWLNNLSNIKRKQGYIEEATTFRLIPLPPKGYTDEAASWLIPLPLQA